MKQALASATLLLSLTSCASMVSHQTAIPLSSTPPGASFVTSEGVSGTLPTAYMPLDPTSDLRITVTHDGHMTASETRVSSVSPWILGNLIFGGIPGFAIDLLNPQTRVINPKPWHFVLQPAYGPAKPDDVEEVVYHADLAHDSEDAGQ